MISINAGTRQFTIPGADLVFGVEADNGTERKHFQCPRYVGDGLDVASCFVRINYRNANGEIDSYLVDDLKVDNANVAFTWLLHPKVTAYKGQVKFVMCLVGPDLKLKWHTTQGTGQVLEGLEPDNSHVEDETADVVAALIAMVTAQTAAMESVGEAQRELIRSAAEIARNNAVAEIEAKRVNSLTSIPNDYATLNTTVEKLARSVAPGIICDAEGEAITLSDASNSHVQSLRIFGKSTQNGTPSPDNPVEIVSVENPVVMVGGKNLIPKLSAYSGHGITITENLNGTATINGTTTNTLGYKGNSVFLPAGTYTLKCNRALSESTWLSISNTPLMIFPGENKKTFTLDSGYHWLYFYANAGVAFDNYVLEAQLEFGGSATEFAPYEGQSLATSHTIRGIPVASGGNYTDSNGQQWICDEVDFERGVLVQRTKEVTLTDARNIGKSLPNDETSWMYYYITPNKEMNDTIPVLCDSLQYNTSLSPYNSMGFRNSNDGNSVIYLNMSAYMAENNTNGLGAVLNARPITFVYSLVTPIETPLTETELAAYRSLHTNKPNTTILNDSGAHMAVEYTADTKLYIDNKLKR